MTEHKKLTAEELGATRYLVNRGVYIAQGDQIRLFDHIAGLAAGLCLGFSVEAVIGRLELLCRREKRNEP